MTGLRGYRFTYPELPPLPQWARWVDRRVSREASTSLRRGLRLPDLTGFATREERQDALSRMLGVR